MKRFILLVAAALLFHLMGITFALGHLLFAAAALAALIAIFVLGSRLSDQRASNRLKARRAEYEMQSKWTGTELVVRPRWFKRLWVLAILLGLAYFCFHFSQFVNETRSAKNLFLSTLILATTPLTAYAAWLTLVGWFREMLAGYSLKVDASGLTFAGHATMPWNGICRAGHHWHENEGFVEHSLVVEFNPVVMRDIWPHAFRFFLLGPAGVGMGLLRGKSEISLLGSLLASPVPTISTAICIVGSRFNPQLVVPWRPHESLADARRLDELRRKMSEPVDDKFLATAFQRAANKFSAPSAKLDQTELDQALKTWEQETNTKAEAFHEYSRLSIQVLTKSSRSIGEEFKRGAEVLTWFFALTLIVGIAYTLIIVWIDR